MYGINANTQELSSGGTSIPAGINEDCVLSNISFEKLSDDKEPLLMYVIADSAGRELKDVLWPVNPEQIAKNLQTKPRKHARSVPAKNYVKDAYITAQEAVDMAFDEFNARLKHVLKAVTGLEEVEIAATSYQDLSLKVVNFLTPYVGKNKIRAKVVLNDQNYSTFPRYGVFLEPMTIEAAKTRLSIGPKDKIVRDGSPDANQPTTAPAGTMMPPGTVVPPTMMPPSNGVSTASTTAPTTTVSGGFPVE